MTTATFITTPSPELRTFFLGVAKRANEMQRDLVKEAQRNGRVKSETRKRKRVG